MPCFKNPIGNSYNFNEAADAQNDENNEGRREGIYTGSKLASLGALSNLEKHEKTEEDHKNIKNAISNNSFLNTIFGFHHPQVLQTVIDAMCLKKLGDQENLFFERTDGNEMFVSRNGIYNVIKNGKKIGIFSDQRVIGELAMFYKSRRPFTIRTVGKAAVWTIDRFTFQTILVHNAIDYDKQLLSFLKKVPEINKLSDESLGRMVALFEKEYVPPDTVIVYEETEIKKFCMLNDGWAVATKDKIGKVRDIHRGDFFGEQSLFQKEIINSTITAKDNGAEFLTLNRGLYQKHFTDNTSTQNDVASFDNLSIEENVRNLTLNDFEKVETIGKGGFGKVDIVYNKNNKNQIFALKYVNRTDVIETQQIENIFNEKNIQINIKSNFIVRMYRTYKDKKYLYFLLESCMGGDLYSLLQKQKNKQLPEAAVKFYSACVTEAFDYLHKRNCIYRDLKPENLLIDTKGYAKIADFGFSKKLTTSKTYTFSGTPEYLAPEIILNQGHDKAVDFWALGVLIFELLSGRTPFESADPSQLRTYEAILKGIKAVEIPKHFSLDSIDIIKRLCVSKPVERLNFAEDMRRHKFFSGFSWNNLQTEKIKAPVIPQMTHPLDIRNFEVYRDNYVPPDEIGEWAENF